MEETNETKKMENQPDELDLKLSDAFETKLLSEPVLECKARMLNINYGHNEKILKSCKRLHDYSYFMKEVNVGLDKGMELDEAIASAMDDCIEKNVLADILLKCKSEVFNMLLTEYDEKKHLKYVKEEGKEEKSIEIAKKMLQKGESKYTIAEISELTGLSEDEIKALREN